MRGKTGRVYGHLQAMLVTAKGLPLTYNKDLQEDKEGFFDAVDNVKFSLAVYSDMISTMTVKCRKNGAGCQQRLSLMLLILLITSFGRGYLSDRPMKL